MKEIRPSLRSLHSPDVTDLEGYIPDVEDCFGIFVQAFFGPDDSDAEESFDIMVCSPKWIEHQLDCTVFSGRHHLIVLRFDLKAIRLYLANYAVECSGSTWNEVALKLSRIGKWEFEDYEVNVDNDDG